MRYHQRVFFILMFVLTSSDVSLAHEPRPFVGSWAFELPDGNPVWLRIHESDDGLQGELLWSVGSARAVKNLRIKDGRLSFQRRIRWKPFGETENEQTITEPMVAQMEGTKLILSARQVSKDGSSQSLKLAGKQMPPLPPRPDFSRLSLGDPIRLFNGANLDGWVLSNPKKKNGWRAEDGVLVNETPKKDFSAYGEFGNLRTIREFRDFQLTIEYNVPISGNSGVYVRGMYEAQVVDRDSRMQGISGPGAIFGRIRPSSNVGRPGGEWNRYQITLVDRHITIVLNGQKVIDNQPVMGCTGGGLSADDTKPGPILLQGDHTSVQYRNIELRLITHRS